MATKIFVNLPVSNLATSIEFFTALGFTFNPQFTDETATCMIISEDIFAMLITHNRFKDFTKKDIASAHTSTEVIVCELKVKNHGNHSRRESPEQMSK